MQVKEIPLASIRVKDEPAGIKATSNHHAERASELIEEQEGPSC